MTCITYYLLVGLLLCVAAAAGEVAYDDPDAPIKHEPLGSLPQNYDFIVVGSGAGGSTVASNLAKAFPKRNVLVVEGGTDGQRLAGGTDYVATKTKVNRDGVTVRDPFPYTKYDVWIFETTISNGEWFLNNTWGISNLSTPLHQRKVIGGNMVCNGMSWLLPTKNSFDRWHLPGYSGDDLWPYYLAIENYTGTPFAGNPEYGIDGPIKVSLPNFTPILTTKFNTVLQSEGYQYVGDLNNGTYEVGYAINVYNTLNGVRDSTSVALLVPTIKTHRNLFLGVGCTVTVVLFDRENNAKGVECVDFVGHTWKFYASREVILSAGSLQTAKILMNSGIGPLSTLRAFGKPERVVNEMIGQKIMNQQNFGMTYQDLTLPSPNYFYVPVAATQYAAYGEGPFGNPNGTFLALHVDHRHPTPDILAIFIQAVTPAQASIYSQQFGVTIALTEYQLYMNGTLNLTSSDPLANTTFKANLFVYPEDVNTLVKGVKKFREVMEGWPTATELYPGPNVTTDAEIAAAIRETGSVSVHFSGSVPIGKTPEYPLDLRMRVRGVHKLRVVDASVMHGQISRGMQATVAMIAQKASGFIIEDNP